MTGFFGVIQCQLKEGTYILTTWENAQDNTDKFVVLNVAKIDNEANMTAQTLTTM